MIIKANFIMGLKSLLAAKQRSFLALLGIVIGIGSVIAMVSIGITFKENSLKQFLELGTDYLVISPPFFGGDDDPNLSFEMVYALPARVRNVKEVTPVAQGGGRPSIGGETINASVLGVNESFLNVNRFEMADGRFISDFDKDLPYCVIGEDIANDLRKLGHTNLVGLKFKMLENLYTIVGVLKRTPSGGLKPFNPERSIMIHMSIFYKSQESPRIDYVIGRMKETKNPAKVTEDIKSYFKIFDPRLDVDVRNAESMIKQMESQMQMITIFLAAVGSIALIVGGVGVMNVMLVSVAERKKEIGIRRALGAFKRDIRLQFVIESLVLCIIGGSFGIAGGIFISYIFANHYGWEFVLSQTSIILGVGVSTAVGLLTGYYPANQAASLDPIVALRS